MYRLVVLLVTASADLIDENYGIYMGISDGSTYEGANYDDDSPPSVGDIIVDDFTTAHNSRIQFGIRNLGAVCDIFLDGEELAKEITVCNFPTVYIDNGNTVFGESDIHEDWGWNDEAADLTWSFSCEVTKVYDSEASFERNHECANDDNWIGNADKTPFWYNFQPALRMSTAGSYSVIGV